MLDLGEWASKYYQISWQWMTSRSTWCTLLVLFLPLRFLFPAPDDRSGCCQLAQPRKCLRWRHNKAITPAFSQPGCLPHQMHLNICALLTTHPFRQALSWVKRVIGYHLITHAQEHFRQCQCVQGVHYFLTDPLLIDDCLPLLESQCWLTCHQATTIQICHLISPTISNASSMAACDCTSSSPLLTFSQRISKHIVGNPKS